MKFEFRSGAVSTMKADLCSSTDIEKQAVLSWIMLSCFLNTFADTIWALDQLCYSAIVMVRPYYT